MTVAAPRFRSVGRLSLTESIALDVNDTVLMDTQGENDVDEGPEALSATTSESIHTEHPRIKLMRDIESLKSPFGDDLRHSGTVDSAEAWIEDQPPFACHYESIPKLCSPLPTLAQQGDSQPTLLQLTKTENLSEYSIPRGRARNVKPILFQTMNGGWRATPKVLLKLRSTPVAWHNIPTQKVAKPWTRLDRYQPKSPSPLQYPMIVPANTNIDFSTDSGFESEWVSRSSYENSGPLIVPTISGAVVKIGCHSIGHYLCNPMELGDWQEF